MPKTKELNIKIITRETAFVEEVTPPVDGQLECVIVNVIKGPVSFSIALEKFPDVTLVEVLNFFGQRYLALRTETIADDNSAFPHTQVKWSLKDNLIISVEGVNSEVDFIIRYS